MWTLRISKGEATICYNISSSFDACPPSALADRERKSAPPAHKPIAKIAKTNRGRTSVIWPSGGTWMPDTANWGTRSADSHGCGKCRWNPKGCRGCIAAAAGFTPPTLGPMVAGTVSLPSPGVDADFDAIDLDDRQRGLQALHRSVAVRAQGQSDAGGFGVVALRLIRKGELLEDIKFMEAQIQHKLHERETTVKGKGKAKLL